MNIVKQIQDIIKRLLELRLKGTFMLLELSPEKGGMQGFVDRFNKASLTENVDEAQTGGSDKDKKGIAQYTEKGMMFGIILLYGYPGVGSDYLEQTLPEAERQKFISQMSKNKKALEAFIKLLGLGS